MPSYQLKGWSKKKLLQNKERFACNHTECLGWAVYTEAEKDELQHELYKLADTRKVRLYSNMFRKGFGKPLQFYKKLIGFLKTKVKSVVK